MAVSLGFAHGWFLLLVYGLRVCLLLSASFSPSSLPPSSGSLRLQGDLQAYKLWVSLPSGTGSLPYSCSQTETSSGDSGCVQGSGESRGRRLKTGREVVLTIAELWGE